jgi:hypothetical protein
MTPVTDLIYKGGYLNPFDLALVALVCCAVGAAFLWEENYGEESSSNQEPTNGKGGRGKWYDGLKNALTTTMRNREILLCGIISSFFEGSM